jgi:hypothetical protein
MRICNAPFGFLRPFGSKRLLRHRATNPKTEASGETFSSIIFLFSSILTQEEQYNFSAKRLLDQTFLLKYLIYSQFIWSSRNKFVTLPCCLV